MPANALVVQSGGPSPVINSSLLGISEACRDHPDRVGRLYAGWHGIEGILREELIDLSSQPAAEMALLRSTASAGAIGTCRYRLERSNREDLERIVAVLRAHRIGWFFCIGGNDSMETAHRIASLARDRGLDLAATGVPKTIDNDLGDGDFRLIDHTPGYGSAARYWASVVRDLEEENRGMGTTERVCVVQAMGRSAGFLPAAARLADPERRMPLLIFCAESGHTLASLAELVDRQLAHQGRCIVVVSEGFDTGGFPEVRDSFGHVDFGASGGTAAQAVVNHLNRTGLGARGYATGQVPGVLQRSTALYASTVDIEEASAVGRKAVEVALRDGNGWMATILRAPGDAYRAVYDRVPLEKVAGATRRLPPHWIAPGGTDVTDEFVRYARPLIGEQWAPVPLEGGLQRFARLEVRFIEQKLPGYVPVLHRDGSP